MEIIITTLQELINYKREDWEDILESLVHLSVMEMNGNHLLDVVYNEELSQIVDGKILSSLILAIENFAGVMIEKNFRSISFSKIRIAFTKVSDFLILIATDKSINIEVYHPILVNFANCVETIYLSRSGLKKENIVQNTLIALIDTFSLFSMTNFKDLIFKEDKEYYTKYIMDIDEEKVNQLRNLTFEAVIFNEEYYDSLQSVENYLGLILNDLKKLSSLGLVHMNSVGTIDFYHNGNLDATIMNNIFDVILDKSLELNVLLSQENDQTLLDLEDRTIVFIRISPSTLMLLVYETNEQFTQDQQYLNNSINSLLSLYPKFSTKD